METAFRKRRPRSTIPVHLMVSHDGEVHFNVEATFIQLHSMNFVVVDDGGRLVVWKDRYDLRGFAVPHRSILPKLAVDRAMAHQEWALAGARC